MPHPAEESSAAPAGKLALPADVLVRALQQSRETVLVTDAANRIVYVNPAFTELTGYTRDEVLGRGPSLLSSGHAGADFYLSMRKALAQEGHWEGEIWNKHKDGSIHPCWLIVSTLRDDTGAVAYHVANYAEISVSREATDRLAHLAYHDPLTDLPNRLSFEVQLAQILRLCEREKRQLALMLIDLDNFKNINDTLGHHVGDGLLRMVAQRLRTCVRSSDLVARLGGDEFVVVLPDIDAPASAARVAAKIQRDMAGSYRVAEHVLYATPSIGISLYPDNGRETGILLRNADTAMYHAKSAGRNNHQFYATRMNEAASERLQLESELRQAIAGMIPGRNQFSLHFQPQVASRDGRVTALEALLRWDNPMFGSVPPLRFITIAEETGLIQPLGDWVIWETCRCISEMRAIGITGLPIAINVSAQQLRHENLLLMVRGALSCHDLPPSAIELEVTESTAMQNPDTTVAILEQLARMGVRLAIDDFGTGYSSLAYLKHLPIKRLKLDRSFVTDIECDANDSAICAATIALGHSLGLEIVAEGVETDMQREFLTRLNCDFLQGYLFSRPLPFTQTLDWLLARWNLPPGG